MFNINLEGLWDTLEKMVQRGEFMEESMALLKAEQLQVHDVVGKSEVVLPLIVQHLETHSTPMTSGEEVIVQPNVSNDRSPSYANKIIGLYPLDTTTSDTLIIDSPLSILNPIGCDPPLHTATTNEAQPAAKRQKAA